GKSRFPAPLALSRALRGRSSRPSLATRIEGPRAWLLREADCRRRRPPRARRGGRSPSESRRACADAGSPIVTRARESRRRRKSRHSLRGGFWRARGSPPDLRSPQLELLRLAGAGLA